MYAIEATTSDGEQKRNITLNSSVRPLKTTATLPAKPAPRVLNPLIPKPQLLCWFVAITPSRAMVFPLVVPFVMARVGIAAGVGVALVLSSLWFVAMLKTSEMPH